MAFESLNNLPLSERELVERAIVEIRQNYLKYQSVAFFLKLSNCGGSKSQVAWTKQFETTLDMGNFFWGFKYNMAMIAIKFEDNHFQIYCGGFHTSFICDVWPDRVEREHIRDAYENLENFEHPPLELLAGFDDLKRQAKTSVAIKRKKAI